MASAVGGSQLVKGKPLGEEVGWPALTLSAWCLAGAVLSLGFVKRIPKLNGGGKCGLLCSRYAKNRASYLASHKASLEVLALAKV